MATTKKAKMQASDKEPALRCGSEPESIQMLTDEQAKRRDGAIDIIRTFKTRAPAMKQARARAAGHFVIAHEDGRFSVARDAAAAPGDPDDVGPVPPKAKAVRKAAGKSRASRTTKAASSKRSKGPKLSALGAAAQVLAKAKGPMRVREIVEQMASRGLWESPRGKTPQATLYAAMVREINEKGDAARFRKVDRGAFARIEAT